ncbi:hypothetical protein TI03_06720, partial [Achromatium sp. WMS1]
MIVEASALRIGGFNPFTTIDYPDALAAVVFCQGCSWRCRYCHNPELVATTEATKIQWSDIIEFLKQRQGLLDAVVFSGGEPTIQQALLPAIKQVKALNYQVGVHTAGSNPKRLRQILPLVDWVGFDIKADISDYAAVTCVPNSGKVAWSSIKDVIKYSPSYEIRITVH